MSSCVEISSTEQLCYIPCSYCNIVLAVSVPCSSLFDIVTVRCGHCSNLWSVNMAAAAFHSHSSAWQHHQPQQQHHHPQQQQTPTSHSNPIGHNMRMGTENMNMNMMMGSSSNSSSSSTSRYYSTTNNTAVAAAAATNKVGLRPVPTPASAANPTADERVVNRPPEKRQRVPSAYNQFIKEEIQRIKANNPDISHREAFSTAAKNWAHFPHIHFGLMLENNNQAKLNETPGKRIKYHYN